MEQQPSYPISTENNPFYFVLILIITLGAFAAGIALGFFGRPLVVEDKIVEVIVTTTPDPALEAVAEAKESDTAPPTIMDFVLEDARHIQGEALAPVTIVEFSDFKCGYCGLFAVQTLPQIRETYVETGIVRFAYRNMAVLGPESTRTAIAGECAAEQGNFWEFHDMAYTDQATTRSILNDEKLIAMAGGLSMDTTAFQQCLESGRYSSQIGQETMSAQSLGIRGTPSFLINGVFVTGAQPFEAFQQIIEEQIQAAN